MVCLLTGVPVYIPLNLVTARSSDMYAARLDAELT